MHASTLFSLDQNSTSMVITLKLDKVDLSTADELKVDLIEAVTSSTKQVVVDMSAVNFIDSSGLGALVSIRKRLPEDRDMRFTNMSPFVSKVLRLTKLDQIFDH